MLPLKSFIRCTVVTMLCTLSLFAQDDERLDEKIDKITFEWDNEATTLATYEGLARLCADLPYRKSIFSLLDEVHHYDSVLVGVLTKMSKRSSNKQISKALKDIEKLEEGYSTKAFVHFMNEECHALKEIEKNSDDTRNEVGITSYSSQVYMLETELAKYVSQVTARIDKIRKHVHHLSSHYEN